MLFCINLQSRNLEWGIRSLFDPCVNTMGRQPLWRSHIEMSYCTPGFGAIIRYDLPRFYHVITYMHEWFKFTWENNSCLMKLLGRLSYEKIWRYSNFSPYVTARWLPRQIPPLNFLVHDTNTLACWYWSKNTKVLKKLFEWKHLDSNSYSICLELGTNFKPP